MISDMIPESRIRLWISSTHAQISLFRSSLASERPASPVLSSSVAQPEGGGHETARGGVEEPPGAPGKGMGRWRLRWPGRCSNEFKKLWRDWRVQGHVQGLHLTPQWTWRPQLGLRGLLLCHGSRLFTVGSWKI